SGVTVTFSSYLGVSPVDVQNVRRSSAFPPNRSAGEPRDLSGSSRLDESGSRGGSARSVAPKEIPRVSDRNGWPSSSTLTLISVGSPLSTESSCCSKTVGVGLGSADVEPAGGDATWSAGRLAQ